jgi:hypothetical protein
MVWLNGMEDGGWPLGGSVHHYFDLSGLSPHKFLRNCVYLRLNIEHHAQTPRRSLGGKTPSEILFPHRAPPLQRFKIFGCHATLLKNAVAL